MPGERAVRADGPIGLGSLRLFALAKLVACRSAAPVVSPTPVRGPAKQLRYKRATLGSADGNLICLKGLGSRAGCSSDHERFQGGTIIMASSALSRTERKGAQPPRRRRPRILRRFFGGLLVLGGAVTGVHFAMGAESPLAPITETVSLVWSSDNVSFEDVADYWLDPGKRGAEDSAQGRGAALALAIRLGRLEALRGETQPVPAHLKRRFKKHFSQQVLNDARWIVAEPNSRIGRILGRWPVEEGAVTLGNVIVFKTSGASRDKELFAHELAHVEQYRALGTGEFARRYAADPEPIEAEARAKARRIGRSS